MPMRMGGTPRSSFQWPEIFEEGYKGNGVVSRLTDDSVNSWPGLLAQLNKTFLLIRDLFGYALPGGVFLAIGILSKRFSVIDIKSFFFPYQTPVWAIFILLVGACYIVGDILATIAYMPIAIRKWIQWLSQKSIIYPLTNQPADFDQLLKDNAKKIDWLTDNPTEVTGDLLEIRGRHPEFFVESDRRETLLLLSACNAVALLGGTVVFYFYRVQLKWLFLIAGVILLIPFPTGIAHLRRVRWAIRQADKISDTTPPKTDPDFHQFLTDLMKAATDALGKLRAG